MRKKKMIKKLIDDKKDIFLGLLEYRATPLYKNRPSRAELLFGRKIQGHVPVQPNLLQPKFDVSQHVKFLKNRQNKQEIQYNKNAKNLEELKEGDRVMLQDHKTLILEPRNCNTN